MIAFFGTAGLRLGEALGLPWNHIDLVGGKLQVRRVLQRVPGLGIPRREDGSLPSQRPPEPYGPDRPAAAPGGGKLRLSSRWTADGLVFRSPTGAPLDQGNVWQAFRRALDRAGLPHIRLHDLRHTAATLLLQRGVHPKVQELLGHTTISITLDFCVARLPRAACRGGGRDGSPTDPV